MSDVAGDDFQIVIERRRGDLEIRIGKRPPCNRQPSLELAINTGNRQVVREDRQRWKYASFDVLQVVLGVGRTVSSTKKLAHRYRACKLRLSRYG